MTQWTAPIQRDETILVKGKDERGKVEAIIDRDVLDDGHPVPECRKLAAKKLAAMAMPTDPDEPRRVVIGSSDFSPPS